MEPERGLNAAMDNSSEVKINVEKATLEDLNHDMTMSNIPVLVFIALIAFLGIAGNTVVVIIYSSGYPKCNFKYFVIILAGIDLTSCIVLMPLEMVTFTHWFMFPSSVLCKIKSSLNAFTVTASASSLLLIAIDRFRKVCKPHGPQINPQLALKLTALVLGLALIPAISDGVFWGIHTHVIEYKGANLTAQLCEKDDHYKHTIWPTLHTMVLYSGSNIIIMFATLLLYIMIARKLFCQPKSTNTPEIMITTPETGNARESIVFKFDHQPDAENMRNTLHSMSDLETGYSESDVSGDSTGKMSDDEVLVDDVAQSQNEGEQLKPDSITVQKRGLSPSPRATKKTARISLELQIMDGDDNNKSVSLQVPDVALRPKLSIDEASPKSPDRLQRRRFRRRRSTIHSLKGHVGTKLRRKTFIMFILTLIFVATTLAYLTMISHMAEQTNIVRTFTVTERTVWLLFLRFYFINSFINPLLYGFLDTRFRRKLWDMGIRVQWLAGSIKRNIGESMRGSSSGRQKTEVYKRPSAQKTKRPKSSTTTDY